MTDEKQVDVLVEKWNAMLDGLQDGEVRTKTAYAIEQEALYLKDLTETQRKTMYGPLLKYVFPVLRRVVPDLLALGVQDVRKMVRSSISTTFDRLIGARSDDLPHSPRFIAVTLAVADRLYDELNKP